MGLVPSGSPVLFGTGETVSSPLVAYIVHGGPQHAGRGSKRPPADLVGEGGAVCTNLARCGPNLLSWRTCGTCRECRERKISDLTGRCLAEQYNPSMLHSFAVDLTYKCDDNGESPLGALVLQYRDVDICITKMRDAVWSDGRRHYEDGKRVKRGVRFLVAGEYGAAKGRAHWHMVCFIYGDPMPIPAYGVRSNWDFWPHGFSWFKAADRKAIAYAVKYALKPVENNGNVPAYVKKVNYSRYPPLGDWFFQQRAEEHARRGLAVWDNVYKFHDIRSRNGKLIEYRLTNVSLERYLKRYVESWFELRGGLPPMTDFLVENYFDPIAKEEREADSFSLEKRVAAKRARDPLVGRSNSERVPSRTPSFGSRKHCGTFAFQSGPDDAPGIAVVFTDGAVVIDIDGREAVSLDGRSGEFHRAVSALGLGEARADELVAWVASVRPRLDPPGLSYGLMELDDVERGRDFG